MFIHFLYLTLNKLISDISIDKLIERGERAKKEREGDTKRDRHRIRQSERLRERKTDRETEKLRGIERCTKTESKLIDLFR